MKVVLEADGGSRGNPGVAGSGTVIYEADHSTVIQELSYVVGKSTNNVAEYHALLNGLRFAARRGATQVDVFMDSKLVVEQMSGRWKIKHPDMKALATKAREVMRGFEKVTFTWVPRSKNSRADGLANKAMDAAQGDATPRFLKGYGDTQESPGRMPSARKSSEKGKPVAKKSTKSQDQQSLLLPLMAAGDDSQDLWVESGEIPTTHLIVLRHGETAYSAKKQYCGHSDPELTQRGKQQAEAAAEYLKGFSIDRVVCSPLLRARQTAEAFTSEYTCDQHLIEQDFGQWDGLTYKEAWEKDPEIMDEFQRRSTVCPPGGESFAQVHRRVREWEESFTSYHLGETILIVTHMAVAKSLVRIALGANADVYHSTFLDTGSICRIDIDTHHVLRSFNETAYLANIPSGK